MRLQELTNYPDLKSANIFFTVHHRSSFMYTWEKVFILVQVLWQVSNAWHTCNEVRTSRPMEQDDTTVWLHWGRPPDSELKMHCGDDHFQHCRSHICQSEQTRTMISKLTINPNTLLKSLSDSNIRSLNREYCTKLTLGTSAVEGSSVSFLIIWEWARLKVQNEACP